MIVMSEQTLGQEGLALKVRNPTHGSGWTVQILPTLKARLRFFGIPPTGVGGWFRSNLRGESVLKGLNNSDRLVLR